jgi:metallo-beta-lactamase class B
MVWVLSLLALMALVTPALAARAQPPCSDCPVWNMPQEPFRIFGNTYYVGPHGLSVVLVTSPKGHVLLDAALPESAPQIAAHIRQLGFRLEDIKLIVNSHVHFDHAGGIAELQKMTGARVVASQWTAGVLRAGRVSRSDPQYGLIRDTPRVSRVATLHDGEVFRAGNIELTAHLTGGHTPGGTSWTWKSCETANNQETRCLNMVYADSLTPVSLDGFRFSDSAVYSSAVQDFEKSYAFLRATPCDILLTPHPAVSAFWDRVARGSMLTPNGCVELADRASAQLQERLATERRR